MPQDRLFTKSRHETRSCPDDGQRSDLQSTTVNMRNRHNSRSNMYKDLDGYKTPSIHQLVRFSIEVNRYKYIGLLSGIDQAKIVSGPATAKTSAPIDPASRFWP